MLPGSLSSERNLEALPSARGSDSLVHTVQPSAISGSGSLSCHKPAGISYLSNSCMHVSVFEENLPNALSFTAKLYLSLAGILPSRTLSWLSQPKPFLNLSQKRTHVVTSNGLICIVRRKQCILKIKLLSKDTENSAVSILHSRPWEWGKTSQKNWHNWRF